MIFRQTPCGPVMDTTPETKAVGPGPLPRRRTQTLGDLFKPHESIPRNSYFGAVVVGLIVIFGGWGILSYGGFVQPAYFLPPPTQVISAPLRMVPTRALAHDGP